MHIYRSIIGEHKCTVVSVFLCDIPALKCDIESFTLYLVVHPLVTSCMDHDVNERRNSLHHVLWSYMRNICVDVTDLHNFFFNAYIVDAGHLARPVTCVWNADTLS